MPRFITLFVLALLAALPPLLRLRARLRSVPPDRGCWRERVVLRYAKIDTRAWLFAYWKLRLDPLCGELETLLRGAGGVRCALDIGCGFGIPGSALLEWFPEIAVYGIDPLADRVRVASSVFGSRGAAVRAAAPEIEIASFPRTFDLVMMLDVAHFLSDEQLALTLHRIREQLAGGGRLLVRVIIPPPDRGSVFWRIAGIRRRLAGETVHHRSLDGYRRLLTDAGFQLESAGLSDSNPEMAWLTGSVDSAATGR